MRCSHGNGPPTQCSQCIGADVTRIEVRDGQVIADGVTQRTTAEQMAQAEEVAYQKPKLRRGGRAARACSLCSQSGHNAKTCYRRR
jgi:hypothetical protein